jgi:hypothetical protein
LISLSSRFHEFGVLLGVFLRVEVLPKPHDIIALLYLHAANLAVLGE